MARSSKQPAAQPPPPNALVTQNGHDNQLPLDLERMPPEQREFLRALFIAAGSAAAAAMETHSVREEERVPEFYGHSPTDLTRKFSDAPRPAQGGARRRK